MIISIVIFIRFLLMIIVIVYRTTVNENFSTDNHIHISRQLVSSSVWHF